jgi:hypothetical protein
MPSCSLQQVAQHAGASHPPCPVPSYHVMSCHALQCEMEYVCLVSSRVGTHEHDTKLDAFKLN